MERARLRELNFCQDFAQIIMVKVTMSLGSLFDLQCELDYTQLRAQ